MAIYGTLVVHLFLSYRTQDSWIPDPFFTIHLKNIDRAVHGSDSRVYDQSGEINTGQLEAVLNRHSSAPFWQQMSRVLKENQGSDFRPNPYCEGPEEERGITFWDGWNLTQSNWDLYDFFGWWANKTEWFFVYALCAENGRVRWRDIRAIYDGSLFYEIEAKQRSK